MFCHKIAALVVSSLFPAGLLAGWAGHGGDAQHTGISSTASQSLQTIRWQTPVDLDPQLSGPYLLVHYGAPVITRNNTVIVPVKTGAYDGFTLQAVDGGTGAVRWMAPTDYKLPAHNWVPAYSPTLTPGGRVYFAGAGGTLLYKDNLDSNSPAAPGRVAFFGDASYAANSAAYNNSVFINTPLTSDASGNIYFGYQVTGVNPLGLQSGIARIAPDGTATHTTVLAASQNDAGIAKVATNCAPAISADGSKVYLTVNTGNFGRGSLLALNSTTLAPLGKTALKDPRTGNDAQISDNGTSSPTVGPDGRVYYGVLDTPFATGRGWLLNFSGDLTQQSTPGAFGWDDTASIVPASMVGGYAGSSPYLIMTKYNDYPGLGGEGIHKLAILDPNATQIDARTGATIMKEVLTIAGVTPDSNYTDTHPNAVREWCINTAVVDPATNSVLANCEDGKLYRWDLSTNTFTEVVTLTAGLGQAYTPTLVGSDGTVYAINDSILFAVGVPEPVGLTAFALIALFVGGRRRRI